jgi:hypothetical protein
MEPLRHNGLVLLREYHLSTTKEKERAVGDEDAVCIPHVEVEVEVVDKHGDCGESESGEVVAVLVE